MDAVEESIDSLANLEERINRAVQIISELRSDNEQLQGKLRKSHEELGALRVERDEAHLLAEEFQKESSSFESKIQQLSTECENLRQERKQVKNRIEKLLNQLDLLSAS
jgi:chromosome segregation ATPase